MPVENASPLADPAELGWHLEQLDEVLAFARDHHTTGFIIMQGGRLIVEENWDLPNSVELPGGLTISQTPDGRSLEDIASGQKSVTSTLLGIALGRRLLDLDDPVSAHLGPGWTRADAGDEAAITIRHLMTMTSGLDDALAAVAPPGTKWDYNLGAGYHTLKRVIAAVGGHGDLNATTVEWLFEPLGMSESSWTSRPLPTELTELDQVYRCYPDGQPLEGLTTTARDLARFGLAVLSGGAWDGNDLGLAAGFLAESLRSATPLNPAYGLLWWINGQDWQLAPKRDEPVQGWMFPDAPADTVAALGALGRALYVVPSRGLIVVRIGANPGEHALAASQFGRQLWTRLAAALPDL